MRTIGRGLVWPVPMWASTRAAPPSAIVSPISTTPCGTHKTCLNADAAHRDGGRDTGAQDRRDRRAGDVRPRRRRRSRGRCPPIAHPKSFGPSMPFGPSCPPSGRQTKRLTNPPRRDPSSRGCNQVFPIGLLFQECRKVSCNLRKPEKRNEAMFAALDDQGRRVKVRLGIFGSQHEGGSPSRARI